MAPRIRWLTVTATLAVALGLVVAACGGGAEPTGTPRPTAAPTATTVPATATAPVGPAPTATTAAPAPTVAALQPTATPAPTFAPPTPTAAPRPVRGGTIQHSTCGEPNTKDPTKIYGCNFFYSMSQVFSTVTQFKNRKWSDTEFEGDLADSWSISADGKTYTFKINPSARWQNLPPVNGRAVTAADIKWTWELIANPAYASAYRSRWPAYIDRMESPDATTLVVRMQQPYSPFLLQLSNSILKIVAREVYEKDGNFDNAVIGSGPYLFDRYDPGVRVVVKANPNYWKNGLDGKPLPYLDRVESLVIPDPAAHYAAIKAGKIAFVTPGGLSYTQFLDLQKTAPHIVVFRDFALWVNLLLINNGKKPFDDVRVRRAVFKAIDQDGLLNHVLRQPDAPLNGIVAAGILGFEMPQTELKQLLKADAAEAKRLLAAAGFPNGFEVEMSARALATADAEANFAFFEQSLNAVGFKVKSYLPPGGSVGGYAYGAAKKYTLHHSTLPFDGIAWNYLRTNWHSTGSSNFINVSDPVLDKAIEDAEATLDEAGQHRKVQELQRYIIDQAYSMPYPQGWLYIAQQPWLKNFNRVWPWGHNGIEKAWIER